MRFVLVALPVFAFAVSCTRTEAPAPVAAPAEPELTSVAAADEPSCGDDVAACGEEKKAGSCGAHADGPHDATVQAAFDAAPAHGEKALCLVMNREFVVDDRTATSVYEGKTYAFCCDGCKQAFDENPAKYVHADVKAATNQLPSKS
jgi:YHS domain-containing protein